MGNTYTAFNTYEQYKKEMTMEIDVYRNKAKAFKELINEIPKTGGEAMIDANGERSLFRFHDFFFATAIGGWHNLGIGIFAVGHTKRLHIPYNAKRFKQIPKSSWKKIRVSIKDRKNACDLKSDKISQTDLLRLKMMAKANEAWTEERIKPNFDEAWLKQRWEKALQAFRLNLKYQRLAKTFERLANKTRKEYKQPNMITEYFFEKIPKDAWEGIEEAHEFGTREGKYGTRVTKLPKKVTKERG